MHRSISALTLALLASAASPAAAQTTGEPGAGAEACAALADLRLPDVNMLSAVVVPATDALPEFCSVRGYVRPAINFEIRLPTTGWNGGFYMAGCGGFCGQLLSDAPGFVNAMNHGLGRGYAAATMDGGHWGSGSTDARWAFEDRVAEADWGHRAVRETARTAQAVIAAFYEAEPEPSIFAGCSTGGRQANMLAVRDPELFDGIISGAPALDYTGLVATFMSAVVQANTAEDGSQIVTPELVPLIRDTVLAQCDAADGLEDGLVSDPAACEVDWSEAACTAGQNSSCLSEAQIGTLTAWYETGATNSAGERLYPATIPYGSEAFWPLWLTGLEAGGGRLVPAFNANFLAFMAFPQDPAESFTAADFDFDADPARLELMAGLYNSDVPDLSAFAEAGGRMIAWHGLADAIVPHGKTVDYFEALGQTHGEGLDDFARLFLVPGTDHCGIQLGPGVTADGIDPLTAMEEWIETGTAPETLAATRADAEGSPGWTRPVCAWPAVAQHDGSGDPADPASFACVAP